MTIRLVDAGWGRELTEAARADTSELKIICPFIKVDALDRLLSIRPESIQVITRFNLIADGVTEITELRAPLGSRAQVRGVRNLHAKVYLFGSSRAIITSANLTKSALDRRSSPQAV